MTLIYILNTLVVKAIFEMINNPFFSSLISGLIIIYMKRAKKNLSYEIISDNSLITSKDSKIHDFKISYKNEIVNDVYLFVIKVLNSGNKSIVINDYHEYLQLTFSENTSILSTAIIETEQELSIKSTLIDNNIIEFKPVLLNPKDYFIIKIIVSDYDNIRPRVRGRIADVKKITLYDSKKYYNQIMIIGLCFIIVSPFYILIKQIIYFIQHYQLSLEPLNNTESIITSTILTIGLIIIFINNNNYIRNKILKSNNL